jgi:small subunit ribosomal protein S7|tara:strand:- start:201 stop:674 length:474 start_codon:yes stop_codon:yes gene_type:complete
MRRRRPEKRKVLPDPLFGDIVVTKFINNLMLDGKKSIAERIFYKSIKIVEDKTKNANGLDVFKKALQNVSPSLEVKSKRIGGATYQVPMEIAPNRKSALAMRWIISFSKSRKGNTMADRLADELIAASKNEGSSVKKKEETHRMAEANKAFAHFGRL